MTPMSTCCQCGTAPGGPSRQRSRSVSGLPMGKRGRLHVGWNYTEVRRRHPRKNKTTTQGRCSPLPEHERGGVCRGVQPQRQHQHHHLRQVPHLLLDAELGPVHQEARHLWSEAAFQRFLLLFLQNRDSCTVRQRQCRRL